MTSQPHCLVVGAGISGLLAARSLVEHGLSVTILDKSRGVGGRMATRRIGEGVFDHGAQFLSANTSAFRTLVDSWERLGWIEQWSEFFPGIDEDGIRVSKPYYRGMPSMTAVPKNLALGLDIRLNEKVAEMKNLGSAWEVRTETGLPLSSDAVLMTPPLPQTLAILDNSDTELDHEILSELSAVVYQPCIVLLAILDAPGTLGPPGGVAPDSETIRWIADNTVKRVSPAATAITIQATPEFSARQFEQPDAILIRILLDEAKAYLGTPPAESEIHRWRFSEPMLHLHRSALVAHDSPPLVLAGDAFGAPRVEGAALSGLEASRLLLSLFDQGGFE
jgi:renalase